MSNTQFSTDGGFTYNSVSVVGALSDTIVNANGGTSITNCIIGTDVTSIGSGAFFFGSLASITIPSSVTSIGDAVFFNCTRLTSVTIPSSVTSIGNTVFQGCTNLVSVTIPSSVTSIGNFIFYSCSSLASFTIPSSVTSIGNNAFQGCTSLTSITIPNSVTTIGVQVFRNCLNLTSITIGTGVTTIVNSMFDGCTSLTSITIPNSVTTIDTAAFRGCSSLTSITIPNSVTSIGEEAFQGCTSLTSITIGTGVTSLSVGVFYNCTSLTSILFKNQSVLTTIDTNIFLSVPPLTVTYEYTASSANLSAASLSLQSQMNPSSIFIYDPNCFNEDTFILCENEQYIPIQHLRRGDLVKTYKHGYRKIEAIGKGYMHNIPDKFNSCMYKMEKTETNGLIEDLILTGGHSILVDDLGIYKESVKIDDKYSLLVALSKDFKKLENNDLYTYYHLALENDSEQQQFAIWANGVLAETATKDEFTDGKFILLDDSLDAGTRIQYNIPI